ncbi:histidine phosphatase family protein [Oceanimonas smirnovii]|uniref:histidine phosphatase family protein n=1 Tax=Oceanimonas smirnovii TaxID=264574 RepID=UPI003FD33FB3
MFLKILLLLLMLPLAANADDASAWQALKDGNAMLLMRHTHAPGNGVATAVILNDCSTQRNLDEQGKREARDWGERLRRHGITEARVYSSQFCRALETARLLNVGEVKPAPALNSFFLTRERRSAQTEQLKQFITGLEPGLPIVMISHQVNISALTSRFPAAGEALILAFPLTGRPEVLASIRP